MSDEGAQTGDDIGAPSDLGEKTVNEYAVDMLAEGARILRGVRQDTYGSPENAFGLIAAYWSIYLGRPIAAHQVSMMMGLLKFARAQNDPLHRDSHVDGSNYFAMAHPLALSSCPS